eukprot:CAMPEP_0170597818 /NCGR_PEP_ID=MMETSP0224-20130122/15907_1 /TAXON_ID=285029 /ORGANISM="Togula jolla, Strain CCCM 725" /LENGTH=291 /DNA_ID=CAMNT_0010922309 /DNA_START=53 /DNA_END=928 /DNA_ORIENTATION=-
MRRSALARSQRNSQPEVSVDLAAKTAAASARMKRVSEVNRAFHGELVRKRALCLKFAKESAALEDRIFRTTEAEKPARLRMAEELDKRLAEEKRLESKNQELMDGIRQSEAEIHQLQQLGTKLREAGQRNRAILKEQHAEIQERRRAIRELRRHIHIVSGFESEPWEEPCRSPSPVVEPDVEQPTPAGVAGLAVQRAPSSRAGASSPVPSRGGTPEVMTRRSAGSDTARVERALAAAEEHVRVRADTPEEERLRRAIAEYQKLPGLDLQTLLGHAPGTSNRSSRRNSTPTV